MLVRLVHELIHEKTRSIDHVLLHQVLTVCTVWSFAAHKHVLHGAPASQRIPKNTAEPTLKCRTARSVQLHAHWRALI